jgi:hypothetical protein
MISKEDYENLLAETCREFPEFKIVKKSDSRFMRVLDWTLRTISFGKINKFMENFTTTIGATMYVTDHWDLASSATKYSTLDHERVHLRQSKKYGSVLFSLLYLLFPLPIGLAWFRTKFEMEAYEVTLRNIHRSYGKSVFNEELRNLFVGYFTGPSYMWMWLGKKRIADWYDATVAKILEEAEKNQS